MVGRDEVAAREQGCRVIGPVPAQRRCARILTRTQRVQDAAAEFVKQRTSQGIAAAVDQAEATIILIDHEEVDAYETDERDERKLEQVLDVAAREAKTKIE